MIQFDASYSAEDDKIRIRASARLDAETYARVKAAGFGWAPKQEVFYVIWSPGREDLATELSGGELEDEETTLAERAEARAERFAGYKENRTRDAESAQRAVHAIADNIPMGQPILIGHHSERHARRDAEKIQNGMRKSVKMWETAAYWQSRAAGAIAAAKYKEIPAVRARRIKKLESDRRGFQRDTDKSKLALDMWAQDPITLERAKLICNHNHYSACFKLAEYPRQLPASQYEGSMSFWSALDDGIITAAQAKAMAVDASTRAIAHRARWISHLDNRIAYERAMLGESGGLKADKFQIEVGGQVQRRGRWHIVTKVNRTLEVIRSVTVIGHFASTIAIEDVADYRAPAEGVAEKVKAATKLPPMCNYPREGFKHMTAAEFKAKNFSDVARSVVHKATDAHSAHRTRNTYAGGFRSVPVYVTDAKRVDPPAPTGASPAPRIEVLPPAPTVHREPQAPDPIQENLKAARATAKAGVQVVSAPQLFPTPAALVAKMIAAANLKPGLCVLEPSAGTGNIVKAVLDTVDTEVLAYEISGDLCTHLSRTFPSWKLKAIRQDFLEVTDFQGQYPRILMNPPFERGADIEHILHAMKFLAPAGWDPGLMGDKGGLLVAICANGPRQQAELKPLATTWEELPEGTFAAQGTNVRTVMLTIQR
jgi:hypothetical protein